MKFYTKLKVYKAANVVFKPEKCQAYSYGWWRFVDKINGEVIFNSYPYSNTTRRHQSKVKAILRSLNIEFTEMQVPAGLQSERALESALDYYDAKMHDLEKLILNPNTRVAKNKERQVYMIQLLAEKTLAQIFLKAKPEPKIKRVGAK
jgi:hypothetical protein